MLCRTCGKTTSCSAYLRREAMPRVPGSPPKHVRVISGEVSSDRPREECVEWHYGMWGFLFGLFWMFFGGMALWNGIGWYCGLTDRATNPELALLTSPFILLMGSAIMMFSIFGKYSLRYSNGECTYFIGVGKIGRKRRFRLSRDSSAEIELVKDKDSSQYCKFIRISNNGRLDVVIKSLPGDVAEYFCQWISYWAARQ